jgi:hypothetical protein
MDGEGEEENEKIKIHMRQKMQEKCMALLTAIIIICCANIPSIPYSGNIVDSHYEGTQFESLLINFRIVKILREVS